VKRSAERPLLGLQVLTYGASWASSLSTALSGERHGYDMLLGADHLLATGADPAEPFFEGWTTLAAWAALTERVVLGLLVTANSFRNPGLVAKMASTVDHISAGRAILGIGAAWDDHEHHAFGIDAGRGVGERLDWLDESLGVIKRLLAGEQVTHKGSRYIFEGALARPLPVQAPLPLLVPSAGGRRSLGVVARHADIWHVWVGMDGVEDYRRKSELLDARCADAGRDPGQVARLPGFKMTLRDSISEAERVFQEQVGLHGWPDEVRESAWATTPAQAAIALDAYRQAGADGFILQVSEPYDLETIARLAELRESVS